MKTDPMKKAFYMMLTVAMLAIAGIFVLNGEVCFAYDITYYDHTVGINVTNSSEPVNYVVNEKPVFLSHPVIQINGIAIGDVFELFRDEMGLSVTYDDGTGNIMISDGAVTIRLKVGTYEAIVNDRVAELDAAPLKITFQGESSYRIFVPTRFVSESLGYDYVWTYANSTSRITRVMHLNLGDRRVDYNGEFYGVICNGKRVDLSSFPIIYSDGVLIGRAKKIFESLGCTYHQDSENIVIRYGGISCNMQFGMDAAYVNGKKMIMDAPAMTVTNRHTSVSYAAVPIEACLQALGFSFFYDNNQKEIMIFTTDTSGDPARNPFLYGLNYEPSAPETHAISAVSNRIFDITTDSSMEAELEKAMGEGRGNKCLTRVSGYSLEHSDAVVLYGPSKNDMEIYLDGAMLLINLPGVQNFCGSNIYNPGNSPQKYLNYCLVTSNKNGTTIILYLEPEMKYYVYEAGDEYVSVHVTMSDISARDNGFIAETVPGYAEVPSGPTVLPDDRILIPLPVGTYISSVRDIDNYLNYNFVIQIKGDVSDFIKFRGVLNPYSVVEGYAVTFNKNTGYTNISFDTKLVVAYTYEIINDHLCIRVARPNEIYDKIVLLDAGHGGKDPGASANGVNEKDLNFKILNEYAAEYFKDSGIKAYFTRTTDVLISLNDRAVFANEVCADIFVSLHMNSNNSSSPNGTEVFYSESNNKTLSNGLSSKKMAQLFVDDISSAMGTNNRGITSETFYVVKYNKVPAVLIELGFISNSSDFSKLTNETYQRKAAEQIFKTTKKLFDTYPR